MKRKTVPAVDVELFYRAFREFQAAIGDAAPDDRDICWIGAIHQFVEDRETGKNVCARMAMLDDVIQSQRAKISEAGAFPGAWLDVAATAPLVVGTKFDPSLFTWPTGDAQRELEATGQFLQTILEPQQLHELKIAACEDRMLLSDSLRHAVYDYLGMRRLEKIKTSNDESRRTRMNVWIRIFSLVDTGGIGNSSLTLAVTSKVHIKIHRTEQSAREAAAKYGGIVLEVVASSLKGQSEFEDIGLSEWDSESETDSEEKADATAYIEVMCNEVPHENKFQSLTTGAYSDNPPKGDECQGECQEIMRFTVAEGRAYLDALAKELRVEGFTQ